MRETLKKRPPFAQNSDLESFLTSLLEPSLKRSKWGFPGEGKKQVRLEKPEVE